MIEANPHCHQGNSNRSRLPMKCIELPTATPQLFVLLCIALREEKSRQFIFSLIIIQTLFKSIRRRVGGFKKKALKEWLVKNGTDTIHIEPGKLWKNCFIESFNSKVRDEFLNMEMFYTLAEDQVKAEISGKLQQMPDRWISNLAVQIHSYGGDGQCTIPS